MVDDLSANVCVSSKTKDVYGKIFNIIKTINEAKTLAKHLSCNCKCKFVSTASNSNQKWNNKTCQCQFTIYQICKENYSWIPSTCIFRMVSI